LRDVKGVEREKIRTCLADHPVLLLRGPDCTGMIRSVEAILGTYSTAGEDAEERESIWEGLNPDVSLYDGRELTAEDARQLRQNATSLPAIWDRRFAVISYIHRPHFVVLPTLLKLIEEPPSHFSLILTASNGHRVLPTILSRALQVRIEASDVGEIQWWLQRKGKDTDSLRVQACSGDPDIAEQSDLVAIKAWEKDWFAVVRGADFPGSFPMVWSARLEEASEATQVACWNLLVQMVVPFLNRHRMWAEVGMTAIEARNSVQHGWMNKMMSSTLLFKVYALAKTIISRG
jgi:DNA polymerase III, delta subunit